MTNFRYLIKLFILHNLYINIPFVLKKQNKFILKFSLKTSICFK